MVFIDIPVRQITTLLVLYPTGYFHLLHSTHVSFKKPDMHISEFFYHNFYFSHKKGFVSAKSLFYFIFYLSKRVARLSCYQKLFKGLVLVSLYFLLRLKFPENTRDVTSNLAPLFSVEFFANVPETCENRTVTKNYYYYYYYYYLLSPLCRIFTNIRRKQTIFLRYIALKLFCCYNIWHM